ncbi:MAG TPA: lysophospholipid acyltransferase family protein, partial [Planctomycetota bacterium]|nr:lysophospholipid acyltransferase family protein [Planctomycetota bacterium]
MDDSAHLPFRWRRFRPAQLLFYILVRYTFCGLALLETRAALALARLIGRLLFVMDRKHRQIAERNVRRAEGLPKNAREIRRLVLGVYEHFAMSAVETYLIPRMIRRREFARQVERVDWHHMDEALAKGRGAIMACGHLGNWELAGVALSRSGCPLWSVARPIENPYMNAFVDGMRKSWGQKIILQDGAVRGMVDCLKRNSILGLLVDQNVRTNGVFVPFLGRPASTIRSPALLALKYGAPIVPVNIYRDGRG